MSQYLIEEVGDGECAFFNVLKAEGKSAITLCQCDSNTLAQRIVTALEWFDSFTNGTVPGCKPTRKPKEWDIKFEPAPKPRVRRKP